MARLYSQWSRGPCPGYFFRPHINSLSLSGAALAASSASGEQRSLHQYHKSSTRPKSSQIVTLNGSTIVAATQVGRFSDGGASNIGWATSTDNGATWKNGFLPGTTVFATPAGQYDRVSDPSVAYDAAHKLWMISSLAITNSIGTLLVLLFW